MRIEADDQVVRKIINNGKVVPAIAQKIAVIGNSRPTGFVLKHAVGNDLIEAFQASVQGKTDLTARIAQDVLQLLKSSGELHTLP